MQASDLGPGHWLAQTKLRPPPMRPDAIARPRVLSLLHSALLSSRLTLVSAPAGYGKTTLLAALPALMPDLPLAWLSLDEEDGDPARFLLALVLALRHPFADFGATTMSLLAGPPKPGLEPRHVVGALVNELLETASGDCVLVLDDLHLISEAGVYAALDYLLERMPPQLHVATATRHDPPLSLARLRARGQLAELRLADIRFTPGEAAELLNGRYRLKLGEADLARLHAQTEGWPAGLRLVAGSLERIERGGERSAFVAGLAERGRHLFEYLAAEVLDRQEPSVRQFLLETSILPELTPALCKAVTGGEDAPERLEEIDRRGLFVVAGDGGGALRYHSLFADFLQRQLKREMPERVAELHRRAAEASALPGRAVAHYLAAERWEEAAGVVEQVGGPMLLDGLAGTVAGWIQAMPPDVRGDRPGLTLMHGVSLLCLGDLVPARASLGATLRAAEEASDAATAGVARSYLATCLLLQGDLGGAAEMVERALGDPISPVDRVQLLMTRCWLALFRWDSEEASADLVEALDLVEKEGLPDALTVVAIQLKPDLAALPGGLRQLERFVRMARPYLGDRVTPLSVAVQELEACIHLFRGDLERGLQGCERVLADVGRLGGYQYVGPSVAALAAALHVAWGDYVAAGRLLTFVQESFATVPLGEAFAAAVLYVWAKMRLLQGDLEAARGTLQEICSRGGDSPGPDGVVVRRKLEALLAMAERRFAAGERALRETAALEEQMPLLARLTGFSGTLLARLAYERNRPEEALAELAPVLEECEREDIPGLVLLDGQEVAPVLRLAVRRGVHAAFAQRLLAALEPEAPPRPATVPETGELLSTRELEILDLIAAGAGNRAIADELVIGETTVKSHVTSILRKLNVSSRSQAAARARELGLSTSSYPR